MHAYAVKPWVREWATFGLVVTSIALTYAAHFLLVQFDVSPWWWIETPSILGLYGVLRFAFDRWIWRLEPVRRLTSVPNLDGEWIGHIYSSHTGFRDKTPGKIQIHQTWTDILIEWIGDPRESGNRSRSESVMAAIRVRGSNRLRLSYAYLNEPAGDAVETMHMHRGTAELELGVQAGEHSLEGDYYTGRDRKTHGRMCFVRKSA